MFYDLHTHTTASDGKLSPFELIDEAVQRGLPGISITDHDTVDAYTDKLFAYAEQKGIFLGAGIEISTQFKKHSVHILGYDIDVKSSAMSRFLKDTQKRRVDRNRKMVELLRELGYKIDWEDKEHLGRPHMAQKLIDKGYVATMREAFDQLLAEGKPGFVMGDFPSTEEGISLIHEAKGKAFIAHPHVIRPKRLVKKLLDLPFDGIEAHYGIFSKDDNLYFEVMGKHKNLLISGGTDFHGLSTTPLLGERGVDLEQVKAIFPRQFAMKLKV
ncbi:MAG: PHP domain-containing protein [Chlamydiia bacterium]